MRKADKFAELWPIDDIKPYPANAKKHPPEQIKKLAAAIRKFGWTQPIVVDKDGVIIIGHGRRLAAIELGLTKVPVVVRDDLSPEEVDALRLSDNRVTSTEYDTELLQDEIARLFESGMDLEEIGFDARELEFMTADMDAFDDSVFVDDVTEAVEEQKEQNARNVEAVDAEAAPVVDALGFKRCTVSQSRVIRGWMTRIEAETGLKGADALTAYIESQAA